MAIDDWYDTPVGQIITAPYVPPTAIFPTCTIADPPHFPHQLTGYAYLKAHPDALIDTTMRGGKSRIVIDFIANTALKDMRRVLIVCPKSVIPVWEDQFKQWSARPYVLANLYSGSVKQHQEDAQRCLETAKLRNCPAVCVVNYESVWREPFGTWALAVGFPLVVYDECQALCAPGSKQSRFAARLHHRASYRIGLSGTPFPQAYKSVYALYRALDQTQFGTNHERHKQRYFILGGWKQTEIVEIINKQEFKRKVNAIRFHVKESGLHLPPTLDTTIPIILPPHAQRVYDALDDEYYARVESGEIVAANAAAANVRLQQICQGFIVVKEDDYEGSKQKVLGRTKKGEYLLELHTAKQDALRDFLAALPPTEPVVIFCRFILDRVLIHEVVKGLGRTSSELSGTVKTSEDWIAGKTSVLVCEYKAASMGTNFSRSNYLVYYSQNYSWMNHDQSKARCLVHGKTAGVGIYYLTVRNSVDVRIRKALEKRGDTVAELCKLPSEK
jgi:SNF2 family DNA or RNA helicase